MVALIPKIQRYIEKNPQVIPLYGVGFLISAIIIAAGFYMVAI